MLTRTGFCSLFGLAFIAAIPVAQAQEAIGVAVTIRNDVTGTVASRTFHVSPGEDVFRQEIVSTGPDSSAKLVFSDNTNLAVGPDSSVTLDNFVYAGANDYKKATMRLVKGVFRFTTGSSDKRAYELKTDVATISVRGTMFGTKHEQDQRRTIVNLERQPNRPPGRAAVCNNNTFQCVVLSTPGETAVVTETSITNEGVGGGGGWSFANLCPNDPSLCEVTTLASTQPTSPPSYELATAPPARPTTAVTTQPATALTTQPATTVTTTSFSVAGAEFGSPLGLAGFAAFAGTLAVAVSSATSENKPASP
jgi:hypothetical protein